MNSEEVLRQLKSHGVSDVLLKHWDTAQESFPGEDIEFLRDCYIVEFNQYLHLPQDIMQSFHNALETVRYRTDLKRLVWHLHYLLFKSSENTRDTVSEFGSLKRFLGELHGMFCAILITSGLPSMLKFYEERGIPKDILADTMSDLEIWMKHYHKRTGIWGLNQVAWLLLHVCGRIFRLGRLQYIHSAFHGDIKVFRNRISGKVAALAVSDTKYRNDGEVDGTNDIFDSEGAWTSKLEINNRFITGNYLTPRGKAVKESITLPAGEWELVLSCGDPVLEMHIPEGSKMDFNLCGESLKKAFEFFPKYFPEKTFKSFALGTWLLDAQLQDLLPPDANIVRFQKEFYLFPVLSSHIATYERVFGSDDIDIAAAPRDTLLRRVIVDHVLAGNQMRYNLGFILPEDLENWGCGYYQANCIQRGKL